MPTLFSDEVSLFQARMGALNPLLALNPTSVVMTIAQSVLSADNDTFNQVYANIPNQFLGTATGQALIQLAADRNVPLNNGSPSTGSMVFKLPTGTASSTITIPSGTLCSTGGDGITTPNVTVSTQATATINTGQSVSNVVTAQSTTNGANTNIYAGALTTMNTPISGAIPSNYIQDGGTAFTGGTDPWTDAQYRQAAIANSVTKYGAADVEAQILTVPGVYDAYCADPQNGNGTIGYYYCDQYGSVGGVNAASVLTAVQSVLPPNLIIPSTNNGFFPGVTLLTSISVTYAAPAAVQSSAIGPQIQQAVINYIQGNNFASGQPSYAVPTAINPRSGLIHNQALTHFGLQQYVQAALGYQLTYFQLGSTSPSSSTASPGTIYRANGGPSIVQLTRL